MRPLLALTLAVACAAAPRAQTIAPLPASGPTVQLSLRGAVARALDESEEVGLAQSQIDLVETQVSQARASLYPQINGNLAYQRTLASAFSAGTPTVTPDSLRFNPDPTASVEDRIRYLEQNAGLAATGALGGLFGSLPFGQKNVYSATITGSQSLFSPQALVALGIARGARDAARYGSVEQIADVRLQTEQAYIQALVAREFVDISEAALAQAEAFRAQEQLRETAGRASELEVLRADVDLENLRPQLIQAQNAADLAVLNLKRLANIPVEQPVELTTELTLPSDAALADLALDPVAETQQRAAVLAADAQVDIRERQVRLQRAAYLPNVTLQSSYGRQLFPSSIFAFDTAPRTDWTVSVGVSVPIFDGFRRRAQVAQATVELRQAELQRSQLVEAVQLQVAQALREKRRAAAVIAARQRTVQQADRVYRLTELRYQNGLATQLEVSQARLALLSARSNLVQGLADFYTADTDFARATITGTGGLGAGFDMGTGAALPDTAPAVSTPGSPTGIDGNPVSDPLGPDAVPGDATPRTPTTP